MESDKVIRITLFLTRLIHTYANLESGVIEVSQSSSLMSLTIKLSKTGMVQFVRDFQTEKKNLSVLLHRLSRLSTEISSIVTEG